MAEYLDSDYNPRIIYDTDSVRFVDPNPLGKVVPPEDLFIYVNLKARQKSKSVITEVGDNQFNAFTEIKNDINLSVPQKTTSINAAGQATFATKDALTIDWTEIGGIRNTAEKLYYDFESFGITNIDIEIKSQTAPKVVIDFIDVRGATLFEQGSCSPYGLFFNLPYPVFELTVKGYYGKPVNYYLNLVKFNSKFNSDTGNMECRAEFIGYSFAFLSDIIVSYVSASQFLKPEYGAQDILEQKYLNTKKYYNDDKPDNKKIPGNNAEPWCNNPALTSATGRGSHNCTTITDLLSFLAKFDSTDKENIVGSPEYQELTDLLVVEQAYKSYREVVFELIGELGKDPLISNSVSSTSDNKNNSRFIAAGFTAAQDLAKPDNLLGRYFNKSLNGGGRFLSAISNILTITIGKEKKSIVEYDIKLGMSDPAGLLAKINKGDTTGTYPLFDSSYFTTNPWFDGTLKYGVSGTAYTPPTPNNENFIDLGYILTDIDNELKKLTGDNGIITLKRREVIDGVNNIIENRIGFIPTIRNIFTVILCNTDAFMEILLQVYTNAQRYHDENQTINKINQGDNVGISGVNKIYPWPTFSKKNYSPAKGNAQPQGQKETYPGRDFPNWIECIFVEDFIKAFLEFKNELEIIAGDTEGKIGFDNYVPINPLESRMWYTDSPIKYSKLIGIEEIYKTIGERVFINLDHSLFQPVRLTDDALKIPKIGKKDWNPITKDKIKQGEYFIPKTGKIDAWNLLNSIDNPSLIDSIATEDESGFIKKIITQLTADGSTLETVKASTLKKFTNTNVSSPGFNDTDDYYVFKPKENNGGIIIKDDIIIYSNPFKMDTDNLIKILTADQIGDIKSIKIDENTKVGQPFIDDLKSWENALVTGINDLSFSNTAFNSKTVDEAYPENLGEIYQEQKLMTFEKNQLYCTLAMSSFDSVKWAPWWLDKKGSFDQQNESAEPGGSIVSNMGLMSFWDDSYNNTTRGINLSKGSMINSIKGKTLEGKNNKPTDKEVYPGINDDGLRSLISPLITSPLWLDNVNTFRKKVKGDKYQIDPKRQNCNLAYLFLNTLKTTPLIVRPITDDGYLYSSKNAPTNDDPTIPWSWRSFATIGGLAKVPKAWLLAFGSQLWRWREFVGTWDENGVTRWKKPLVCENCSNSINFPPGGKDPLIQPGYNSFDNGTRFRNDGGVGGKVTLFLRNEINYYLKNIYGGNNGVNYNNFSNDPPYQSVFGSNYQSITGNAQTINSGALSGADLPANNTATTITVTYSTIGFRYYPYNKDRLGELSELTKDCGNCTTNITTNYAWPQVYIAPHHIPYISPESFDDAKNGNGSDFVFVTDDWIGYQDYTTIMPVTSKKAAYNERNPKTQAIPQLAAGGYSALRSKHEDGNLGMIVQYLPDDVKNLIVEKFEDWVDSDFANLLPIIDPINFSPSDGLTKSYVYLTGKDSPAANVGIRANSTTDNYVLALKENDDLRKLLTEQYWVLNSTPKIWYGLQDSTTKIDSFATNNDPKATNQFADGFIVSKAQFDLYLKEFYITYTNGKDKRKNDLLGQGKEEITGLGDTIIDDDDIKLSLYRTFKSLSDKWISASQEGKLFFNIIESADAGSSCSGRGSKPGKATLASHFQYVNRTMGDIGDIAVIDISKLNELKDNLKISLYQYISDLLVQNDYLFFPLPTYVNFGSGGMKREDVENMFKPVLSLKDVSCGPLFLCMYVGGSSRQLKLNTKVNCPLDQKALDALKNTADDGFSFEDIDKPIEIVSPTQFDSEGYTAFKVLYGVENQNHFKNIQLDQAEFTETAESLMVIDKLGQQGGNDKTTKGQNLNAAYLTRSYTCQIESLGNFMIQPMSYFDLQGVPMFSGAYLITSVSHNIKPNHATTTFKGVRQPRATLPLVTDPAIAMNISFKGVKPSGTGTSLGTLVSRSGGGGNSGGGVTITSGEWRKQINTTAKNYGRIKNTSTRADVVKVIQEGVEGGYYHPVMWYDPNQGDQGTKRGFDTGIDSGETMFGEDRAAGQTENIPSGAEFWKLVDKLSGYGNYGTLAPIAAGNGTSADNYSKKHVTRNWDKNILQKLVSVNQSGKAWKYNYGAKETSSDLTKLRELSSKIATERTDIFLTTYFKKQPDLIPKINSDARLYFCWVRARYNGPGFFQKYANDLISRYNSNPSATINDLIGYHLDFKWAYAEKLNANSTELIRRDVLKIAQIIGWPKS